MPSEQNILNLSTSALLHKFDWISTSLGNIETWPEALRVSLDLCTHAKFPILILWGEDMVQIYNDAYGEILGSMHPNAYGSKAKDNWKIYWNEFSPMLYEVLREGKSHHVQNRPVTLNRRGYPELCYFTFSYSPIYNGANVGGIFVLASETTQIILDAQNIRKLRDKQLKNLFLQAPVAMCILSGPEFVVEAANDRMLEIWGKPTGAVMNRPVFEAIPEARDQGFEELLNRVLKTGEKVIFEERPLSLIRNGKHEDFFIKLIYEPLREEDGTISGVMAIADEITEQVNARKKIEESETRQRLAIEAAQIGTFDWDIKNSAFQYSDRLAVIFGYPETTGLVQKDFGDRIHPEDQSKRMQAHQLAFETGTLYYEARVVWPDNSIHWVRLDGKVSYDASKKPFRMYGTTLDVTDNRTQEDKLERLLLERTSALKERNEELQKSEERYHKMVVEVQEYAIILLDENGIIQNWNKGAERIKLYTDKEVIGRSFHIFYLPQDRAARLPERLIQEARETGRATHEGWRLRKDQTRFWGSITITALHDNNNNVIGFSKVTRDLTERKIVDDRLRDYADELTRRNAALQESEERYHKMISEVQDYAIILLSIDGTIENWNTGAQLIKGYTADEIIGKNFRVFYTPADLQNKLPEKLLHEALVVGKASHEGWRLRKDGTRFWGNIIITSLHDSTGKPIGFSKVTRDLTEKKTAEEKLVAYATELETRNSELEQFVYIASHDLQEPLRKIQTFSDIILNAPERKSQLETYLLKINSSAKRMSDLIRSVLSYSKLSQEQEITLIDLNQILANVETDFELLIQEKKAIISSDPLPAIKGMALQLNQLFGNLISNALKFSESMPVIKITSRRAVNGKTINKPDVIKEKNYTEISFTDNGIGFDQQYEKTIFTMFQRLHGADRFSGTGIGLALCQKIMNNHNGYITVKSESGKGSTFYLYFPEE